MGQQLLHDPEPAADQTRTHQMRSLEPAPAPAPPAGLTRPAMRYSYPRTPASILSIQRIQGNQATQRLIQRYEEHTSKASRYRVSDDFSMIVRQDSAIGSQALYAEPGKAAASTAALKAAKSVIRLHEVGSPISVKKSGSTRQFMKVEPSNTSTKTSGTGSGGMTIWADCGRSARDVFGTGLGTGGGQPKATYTDPSGATAETGATSSPAEMKREIMLQWMLYIEKKTGKTVVDHAKLADLQAKRDKAGTDYSAAVSAGKDKKTLDDLAARYNYWDTQMSNTVFEFYNTKLTDKQREAFDKKIGINRWADPEVGEGYTISSGGAPKTDSSGNPIRTWNFHWAGVVMKSGGDTATLENYAVGDPDKKNTDWAYQMYGSAKAAEADPSKKGQTFHEQHRDVFGQHGQTPTTMEVEPG